MLTGAILGAAIGTVLGLTGAGGGILAVPALVFGLGMGMRDAAPVALIAVGLAAGVGAIQGLRRGTVRYRAAILMAVVGGLTAPVGLFAAHRLSTTWLSLIFAAAMMLVAYRMFRQSCAAAAPAGQECASQTPKPCRLSAETGHFVWTPRTAATLAAIGAVSGICTGMLGVGGGFIIVPALSHVSELRMHSIVSTSLMVIALIAAATVGGALAHGISISPSAWWFVGAAVVGMGAGRWLAPHLPNAVLQRTFAGVCVAVAGVLVLRTLA